RLHQLGDLRVDLSKLQRSSLHLDLLLETLNDLRQSLDGGVVALLRETDHLPDRALRSRDGGRLLDSGLVSLFAVIVRRVFLAASIAATAVFRGRQSVDTLIDLVIGGVFRE